MCTISSLNYTKYFPFSPHPTSLNLNYPKHKRVYIQLHLSNEVKGAREANTFEGPWLFGHGLVST